jgi:hypothetical protein
MCEKCGEYYLSEEITEQFVQRAVEALQQRMEVAVVALLRKEMGHYLFNPL